MAFNNCVDLASKSLKSFSKKELSSYVQDIVNNSRDKNGVIDTSALEAEAMKAQKQMEKNLYWEVKQKVRNTKIFEENSKKIKSGKLTMQELMILRGGYIGDSIKGAQKADYELAIKQVMSKMTEEDVNQFASADFGRDIASAFDGRKVDNPLAKEIGDNIKDYFKYRESELISSGAMSQEEMHPRRLFMAVHDQERIMNGNKSMTKVALDKLRGKLSLAGNKQLWMNTIKRFLDMNETFKKTEAFASGKLDHAAADKILGDIFDNIVAGNSDIYTKSVYINDFEAIQKKSKMFFIWKDLSSQYGYNKIYGKSSSMLEMFLKDAQSLSTKTGLARKFGNNPDVMYASLRKVQNTLKPKSRDYWDKMEKYYRFVKGDHKTSVNPTFSRFIANIKSMSGMSRLGTIALDSVSDVGYIASFAQTMGADYFKAYTNQLTHLFNAFPTEERIRIAKLLKTNVDSHMGYLGRWGDINNSSQLFNKISTTFFKWNQLERYDKGNRISIMHTTAKLFAENENKSFDTLKPEMKNWLSRFISSDEWDTLRQKNTGGLFTTDNINGISDDELKSLWEKRGKDISFSEMRHDLYQKVHSMFSVAAENAVFTPGEFEKLFLTGEPGTVKGELWNMFMQFKMYGISYVDRVLIQGFQRSSGLSKKLIWASSMLAGTLPLSVMTTYLHYLTQGQSFPDYSRMSYPANLRFLISLVQPSLAVYLGILDPRNQNSSLALSTLSSPSTSFIGNALSVPLSLMSGNPKNAVKNLKKSLEYVAPIQTFPGVSPFIRQVMGEKAYLQPGQRILFGS